MLLRKKLLLLIATAGLLNFTMAQKQNDYLTYWKKIDAFEKKGLTKSALGQVMVIYNLALQSGNNPQQIKAAIYQVKYRNMVEDGSQQKNIFFIDTLISKAKAPVKNILQSMQAEMLWTYLQHNRYTFYQRTKLANDNSKDISTWGLDKLYTTITGLYKTSVNNKTMLQATSIEGYAPVIVKGENTRQQRPTLYDFLAFRALDYFKNDEQDIIRPSYQFTIKDDKAFAPAALFSKASFVSKDTASLQLLAIQILQDILAFHLKDNNPDALLDADLMRLAFINQHAVNENKTALYEAALTEIENKYPGNQASAQAMYLRAQIYFEKGRQYNRLDNTNNQFNIKKAKELAEAAVKHFPKSEGGINAQNLLSEILQPSLTLETEKVNVPNQPFRTLVNYKNTKFVYFRIIKTTKDEIRKMNKLEDNKQWQQLAALKPLQSWGVNLPDPQDYQEHSTEIKVDALDNGVYFLLASIDAAFSLQKNIIAKQVTYVSNISYVKNNSNEYYVLNRNDGLPYSNAQVQVWELKYNYTKSEDEQIKAEGYSTDKNGFFKLKKTKEYRNIQLQVKTNNDELFLDDNNYYNNYYSSYEKPSVDKPISFLFTDRSIYRPGQTVYFKGILVKKGDHASNTTILPATNTSVQLRDANNQKVTAINLVSNDFGSYHGSFKLPEGILNGQFNIYDTLTQTALYFNVEEYKRPKFFTAIQKPAGTYRLFDSIKVTGTAKAYAGNTINGAAVKYRVTRVVRYPIWWGWQPMVHKGRPNFPGGNREEVEITNGTAVTDASGTFSISFKALPDESIDKKTQPLFYYDVSADVTDINGETRSASTTLVVAYQTLQLLVVAPDRMPLDSFKNIFIRSTNLNDVEEKTVASITVEQLKVPAKIFRERYWDQPDQFVIDKEQYANYFPYDVYKNENEVKNYEVLSKAFEKADSTNKELKITNNPLSAGWYKIVATAKDKYGELTKTEKYVELYSNDAAKPSVNPIEITADKTVAEPGQKINYHIKTGFENIWLIHTISKTDVATATDFKNIKRTQPFTNEIAVQETDRGGIAISYVFVQHNRVYKGNENFDIPWSNKELKIDFSTFRDKMLPGSDEKWKVKISGTKGEKVAAEMLVSMYDASLDQFKPHNWGTFNLWPGLYNPISWTESGFEKVVSEDYDRSERDYVGMLPKSYDQLLFSSESFYSYNDVVVTGYGSNKRKTLSGAVAMNEKLLSAPAPTMMNQIKFTPPKIVGDKEIIADESIEKDSTSATVANNKTVPENQPQVRKNFNETAFFFPELRTDAEGSIEFSFTIPEALTQWKLMALAHSKNLASGYKEKISVTQKPLMVQPSAPRFLREGDHIEFTAKIVNLTSKETTGTTQLQLIDAATNKPVDGWFKNIFPTQYFTVAAGQNVAVKFPMEVPFNFNSAVLYRITAQSSTNQSVVANDSSLFSDGEEMTLPVLTNRMLITETLPLNLGNETNKHFTFLKLLNSGNSQSITNQSLTVEYTSNPVWYAVQALPYLMEYPYECAEQTFNRYYANTLAAYVSNSTPKIKAVFDKWKLIDTSALLSNLQKNEELKSVLLQETPWVLDAQNENAQKKNIALLFDMVKMGNATSKAIAKLKDMQSINGGFVWFKGGPDDRYITQYILSGIGHLKKLNALSGNDAGQSKDINSIVSKALPYLDKKIKEEYENLVKNKVDLKKNHLSNTAVQYLYMRSFFIETQLDKSCTLAFSYYSNQAQKYWLQQSKYMQAMLAVAFQKMFPSTQGHKLKNIQEDIIRSLKENSTTNEEMGMYWKEWDNAGYYWHQAPIESQAMMIEAFTDVDKNDTTIANLKTWLLKQKQTQNWKTTKATAEACYALLIGEKKLLGADKNVHIRLGNTDIESNTNATEAGTGYFKKSFNNEEVKPAMGNIEVSVIPASSKRPVTKNSTGSWGAMYWQYFEDLDKITPSSTPLKLVKKLFIEKNSATGPVLEPIEDGGILKPGDKIKVRIELKADRNMEYIHMKDMRAACMEPVNVISGYKYQNGLGYYESTKDASTDFFFNQLNKGTYIFEYSLFITHAGGFSNGVTTIQCMYAPEFTSQSEGIRVKVEN